GLLARDLHRSNVGFRCFEAAELASILAAERLERVRSAFGEPILPLRALGERPHIANLFCITDSVRDEIALDQSVDKAAAEGVPRADRIACGAHLQRLFDPGDARKPLRAACSRQQAKLDLRGSKLCRGNGHSVVAGERNLQTSA